MQQRRGTQAQWTAANPILAAGEIGFETDTSKFKMGNGSSTWSALQYFANASELAAIVGGLSGIDLPASLDTLNELAAALGDDPQFFTTVTNSLALKAPLNSPTFTGTVTLPDNTISQRHLGDDSVGTNELGGLAVTTGKIADAAVTSGKLATSLSLTGVPTAPTASATTNTTQVATTEFVQTKVNELIDAAPGALNTLNELAAAIADDENYAATLATSVGTKVAKAGDTMTGALSLPGAPTELLHAANKGYVDGAIDALDTTAEGYVNTHNSETLSVHGIANTQNLATLDDLASSVSGVTGGYATLGGVGIEWNADTEKFDIDNTVATVSDITDHNAETLNVHGITNTALLETAAGAQTKADTAAADAVSTHNSDTTDVHGIADTAALATKTYADGAVSTHNSDTTGVHGIADTAALETTTGAQAKADAAATAAVSTHSDDTTSVHGIADTSALATKTYADAAVSTHNSDTTDVHGITDTAALATKTYADSAVTTHNNDTTDVHGIADTSILVTTTGTQTISNKTLTTPTINGPTITAIGQTPTIHGIYLPATHNITFEGETANDFETILAVVDPTGDRTVSLPDASGTLQLRVADVSDTEIGYLNGVTSAIQTQIDAKAPLSAPTFTGTVTSTNDVVVNGNLTVNGTTFNASSTSITIEDNIVQLAHQNAANTVDLGLVVAYNDGTAKHSGLVRDVSDDEWKLFKGVTTEPTTTVNFGQGSLDNLELNNLVAAGVVFTDGTQAKEGVPSRTPIIAKTDSYTLSALTERDSLIEVAKATATTITIPTDATLNFPIGTSIDILQTSTGQVTIAGAAGVTVNATPGLKLRTTWSSATLFKRAANTWVVYGDLTA